MEEISPEMALSLLKEDAVRTPRGPKTDPTEPRIAATWFKLITHMAEPCDNPDCQDPRPTGDKGRLVTVLVKGQRMCRYCYISGWLSDNR